MPKMNGPAHQVQDNYKQPAPEPEIFRANFEYTDTFNGEANYSWVKRAHRYFDESVADAKLKREAKAVMGLTGVRGVWTDHGECFEFRPQGSCTVLFIHFD